MARWRKIAGQFAVLLPALLLTTGRPAAAEEDPLEYFNQRILPIFRSQDPSSCVQCHLSSVDLKNYILPSSDATFVSLRDQGLLDYEQPRQSKILTLIRMGDRDLDEGAKRIHAKVREAEFEAFSAWIEACCRDPRVRELPAAQEFARPDVPDEVIRHARKSRLVDSFVRSVWSQRMRCFPCHTPHEIDPADPKHAAAVKTQAEYGAKYSPEMRNRLEIFRSTPEKTMDYLIESSRSTPKDRLPLIDLKDPSRSLLLQKPMSKLPAKRTDGTFEDPSYHFPISHMGGLKLHPHDQSYKAIIAWIQDYAKTVQGRYQSVAELPHDNWIPTQLVVRVQAAPEAWKAANIIQLFVHRWDNERAGWDADPVAFTQGAVTPRRMVNGTLFLLAEAVDSSPSGRERPTALPPGRYLVKAFVDSDRKIEAEPAKLLSDGDYYGEAVIPRAQWRDGFRFAEVLAGNEFGAGWPASPTAESR